MSNPDPYNPYGPPPQAGLPPHAGPPPGPSPYGAPPHDPYAAPPPPAYGHQQPYGQPGYGYPPAHGMVAPMRMPGMVIAGRVLLFVAGGLWVILGVLMLVLVAKADDLANEDLNGLEDAAVGVGIIFFVVSAVMATAHIVSASLFGKGGTATRVVAIVAASVNTLIAVLGLAGSLGGNANAGAGGSPLLSILWLATAVVTLVFCSGPQASQWFKRPRL